ncbi:MAG: 3-hydroxyacyl-[acyl-carrier-protein] dehydratase FabZ [Lachnospiraceae bacterium]
MNHLDINQIKDIIPHRHPFLLIDYIEDYVPGEYAVGYKCVSYREEFFAGHFPQDSYLRCFDIEALAQAGYGAFFLPEKRYSLRGRNDKCRFRKNSLMWVRLRQRSIRQRTCRCGEQLQALMEGICSCWLTFMIG